MKHWKSRDLYEGILFQLFLYFLPPVFSRPEANVLRKVFSSCQARMIAIVIILLTKEILYCILYKVCPQKSRGPTKLHWAKEGVIKVSRLKTLDFHSIGKHKWVFTIPSIPKKLHLVIG